MVDIPPEIWLNIARFLPDGEIVRCMSVNSSFFNLGMDVLYKEMKVDVQTNRIAECTQTLDKLSNPLIASRVQCLDLLLYGDGSPTASTVVEKPNKSARILQSFQSITRSSKLLGSIARNNPSRVLDVSQPPDFEEMLSRFVARIPNHSKIRSFTILAAFVPISYNFVSLFVSIGTAFGTQLHTLSLAGQIELYHGLLHSNPSFPQLKELRLWFHDSFREVPHLPVNGGHIATFVNRLSPHLELLGVRSHMVNLSGLFSQLSLFPSLVHLEVNMHFDALQDNLSFHRFLLNTSHNLKKLNIRRNPSNTAFDTYRNQWLSHCLAEPKYFAKLQSLKVHPGFLGHDVNVQCDFIRHVSISLEEFSFEGKLLEGRDASLVIGALSQCAKLTVLNLSIYCLTIDVLDQLAVALPNLRKLGLRVDVLDVLGGSSFLFGALKDRSYASWRLEDLSIWQLHWGRCKANHDFMMTFPRSIPSLCSFFGSGHMGSSSCVEVRTA